ncbi:phosphoglycerate mutase-like protein [Ramaria rubella]|nr:phosphoglycerate mutase-like protein [Ramaria rubella]
MHSIWHRHSNHFFSLGYSRVRMVSTLVYIVRHGQTLENIQGVIQGQLDTQLDETGKEQAVAVAEALKEIRFDVAFTSDLARAVDTASAILKLHDGIPLQKLSLLRERHMGKLQGTLAFRGEKSKRPLMDDSVEETDVFIKRTLQFWDSVVVPHVKRASERNSDHRSCILVISHSGFIGTLIRSLIGYRNVVKGAGVVTGWCPNTSIATVKVEEDGSGILEGFGDIRHLVKPVVQGNVDEMRVVNSLYHK